MNSAPAADYALLVEEIDAYEARRHDLWRLLAEVETAIDVRKAALWRMRERIPVRVAEVEIPWQQEHEQCMRSERARHAAEVRWARRDRIAGGIA